jgi:hypothetical protein
VISNPNTLIVGYFNSPLSAIDGSSTKFNKETSELNDTIDKIGLTGRYKAFHPSRKQYIFSQQPIECSPKWIIF